MRTLIVDDDFTCRLLLQELLKSHGPVHIAVNGLEALDAVKAALEANEPYDLICLDIMMPEMDGQQALRGIRDIEAEHGRRGLDGAKIVMTTALGDGEHVMTSFREQCDGYLVKPILKPKLMDLLQNLGLTKIS